MANDQSRYVALCGRILLSAIFLLDGAGKIANFKGTEQFMASKGMPAVGLLLTGAIVFQLLGGLSVLAGYKAKLGAIALLIFLAPTTLIFHNFWAYEGQEQTMQMINFLKNLSIMGGLALLVAFGPGGVSMDAKSR